jgi:hypothetical protein
MVTFDHVRCDVREIGVIRTFQISADRVSGHIRRRAVAIDREVAADSIVVDLNSSSVITSCKVAADLIAGATPGSCPADQKQAGVGLRFHIPLDLSATDRVLR